MVKTNFSYISRKKRKKVTKAAKGYIGRAKNCFRIAVQKRISALKYTYISRKIRKRQYKKTCIKNINSIIKKYGSKYSELITFFKTINLNFSRQQTLRLVESKNLESIINKIKDITKIFYVQ